MEPIKSNPEDDSEFLRKLQESANLPPEEAGLSKKRKIQIVIAAIGGMILLTLFLFLPGGSKADQHGKATPAVNRGLMQAEDMRRQKDLFDQQKRGPDEEQWMKRLRALRDSAVRGEEMPNPVPLFPENRKSSARPQAGMGSSQGVNGQGEVGADTDSVRERVHIAMPSSSGFKGVNFKSALSLKGESNMQDVPGEPTGFKPDGKMTQRMSDEYQKALAYNSSEQLVFTRDRREEAKSTPTPKATLAGSGSGTKVVVSAGQELRAVLTESISSDYPSVAKATMTSPSELSGATLLISYSLGEERVTAQVVKLVLPGKEGERAREIALSAVVKSGLPGLAGDVSHHWIPQITAGLANAGLTAGALAYASQNQNKDLGTAVLVAPMIEQSVQGVLKPINYLGRDRPVTVTVPAGTEFTLLVTEGFEVDL